jgi:thiol-disulfide isomerase/thioredoxin
MISTPHLAIALNRSGDDMGKNLRIALVATAVLAVVISGLSILGVFGNKTTSPQSGASPAEVVLLDETGAERFLSEWHGKVVVVNFWATWCAACRVEMPSLDRLQAAMGSDDFEVLTVATGRNAMPAIEKFFTEIGVKHLQILRDERQYLAREYAVLGLPVTVVLDRDGRELMRHIGEAEWDSPQWQAKLAAYVEAGRPPLTQ